MTTDRLSALGAAGGGGWLTLPPVELVAAVDLAPTPDIPLASLRDVLIPRHRADGTLCDWVLSTADIERPGTAIEYRAWRRTWRRWWHLGSITNAVGLQRYVAELDDDLAPTLRDVLGRTVAHHDQGVVVALGELASLADDLHLVRLALSVDDRTGTGIVDDMADADQKSGLVRTWLRPERRAVLAATPNTAVLLRRDDGLVVLHGVHGHAHAHDHDHDSTDPGIAEVIADIVAADLRDDPVVLTDRTGNQHHLSAAEARPLAWLVPHSLRWHLHDVPLAAVWAQWFAGWSDAIDTARRLGDDVTITSQHPMV
jgi:hypothetical protein